MGMVVELIKHWSRVKSGQADIDHLWTYHVANLMSFFCLWSDTDAWAKSGWLRKLLNFVIVALLFVLWPFVILRVYRDFAELSIPRVAEAISVGVGGALTMLSSLRMATERDTLTQAVRAVDEKVLAVPKDTPRWEKWWQETRRNYVTEGRILLVGCLLPLAVGIPQLVYMVRTGRLYFDSAIPLSDVSYSWQWWLQAVYQSCNPTGACFLYSLKEFLWLDTITEKMNFFVSPFMFVCVTTTYVLLAMAGMAIIVQGKDEWFNIIHSTAFPVYVLLMMAVWASVGEFLTESVEAVDDALYNCNWIVAPFRIRKTLLLFKIQMAKPTYIWGGPFFVVGWQTNAGILKNTYYLCTILADIIL